VLAEGLEPHPKSGASASSATLAQRELDHLASPGLRFQRVGVHKCPAFSAGVSFAASGPEELCNRDAVHGTLARSMARDRIRRFTLAAAFIACSLRFLSGCVSYHESGQPYSGTAWWLRNAGRPWHCYGAAPSRISAFAIGVPYTAIVVPFAAASAIGETLILPVDHLFGVPEFPLPAEPSCEAFWGKHESPAPASNEPQTPPVQSTPSAESPPS
jgi:hypothetical protein